MTSGTIEHFLGKLQRTLRQPSAGAGGITYRLTAVNEPFIDKKIGSCLVLDRIVNGFYRPGERIVEFTLAKELGVSQSPVREGLRELAAVGIVTIHPRRGARVRIRAQTD